MRRTLTALLASGLLLVTAACGSGEDGDGDGETRTITHEAGTTEVPVDAERVVTLWASSFSAMYSLGEEPYGYAFNAEPIEGVDYPEGADLSGLEYVGHSVELDIEAIAEIGPDLIIGASVHNDYYEELSRIAPTVILTWDGTSHWKQHVDDVAEVLGLEDRAEQVVTDYETRVAEVADAIGDPQDIEVSVVRFHAEELRLEVKNSFPGQIVDDVGLARPEAQDVEEEGSGFLAVSLENLPLADGDAVFVYTIADADAEQPNLLAQAEQSPLWGNLGAVQNDAVYAVDYSEWLSSNYFAAAKILDDLEDFLGL